MTYFDSGALPAEDRDLSINSSCFCNFRFSCCSRSSSDVFLFPCCICSSSDFPPDNPNRDSKSLMSKTLRWVAVGPDLPAGLLETNRYIAPNTAIQTRPITTRCLYCAGDFSHFCFKWLITFTIFLPYGRFWSLSDSPNSMSAADCERDRRFLALVFFLASLPRFVAMCSTLGRIRGCLPKSR